MLIIDYKSNNHITTATAHNSVIDSPSINLCITDGENIFFRLPQNSSCNGNFDLDNKISVTPSLFLGHLILGQINFSHPVILPLKIVPNVKSVSMQKQSARIFSERKHILTSIIKDPSGKIISALVVVCMWIILNPY